jgi:hypothetical protein
MNKPLWLQKEIDKWAYAAAKPVRWWHLLAFTAGGLFAWSVGEGEWLGAVVWFLVLIFCIHLRNRHEALTYYKERGVDPYDKERVKEHARKVHRELQDKGIIPPD